MHDEVGGFSVLEINEKSLTWDVLGAHEKQRYKS